jgi:hypothetical protein
MVPDVSVRLSLRARNLLIAKGAIVGLFGLVSGYFYHVGSVADYHRGQTVTLSDYTATFETYRATLLQHLWPLWGDLILLVMMFAVAFGAYEGLCYSIAWALGKLERPPRTEVGTIAPDSAA